jgi:hypothetical protein
MFVNLIIRELSLNSIGIFSHCQNLHHDIWLKIVDMHAKSSDIEIVVEKAKQLIIVISLENQFTS